MDLRITEDKDGQLHLERGEFGGREATRRSEFPDGWNEDSIEGAGYRAIEKLYPGQYIEGYDEIGETLYVATTEYVR
jgi:hypothetical protein